MTSRIAQVAIDAHDVERVARFWREVLGWVELEREDYGIGIGPADGGPGIDVLHDPGGKVVKNRLHLDLRADGTTTAEELARLLSLGATHADVGQPADATWTVLADPEGNEFCLLGRTVQEV
jgi:predicted enzyme related to lactoylglutathione lyase